MENLSRETTDIIITIGIYYSVCTRTSSDLLIDSNNDNKWNFGETVQFHSPEDITNKYIRATVVDPITNTIVLSVVLQQEES